MRHGRVVAVVAVVRSRSQVAPSTVAFVGTLLTVFALGGQFIMTAQAGGASTSMPGGIAECWLERLFRMTADGVGMTGPYFTGLLMHDAFTVFFRLGLATFLMLVIVLTILTGIPDNEDGPDFYTLLVGSAIGMMVATARQQSADAVSGHRDDERAQLCDGRLPQGTQDQQRGGVQIRRLRRGDGRRDAVRHQPDCRACWGQATLPNSARGWSFLLYGEAHGLANPNIVVALLGVMMVLVGIAFKLSLVPFHFWCPDAFEGAPAEVGGYLSVASKAASFALLVRFLLAFTAGGRTPAAAAALSGPGVGDCRRGLDDVRQSGGLWADERQATAGVFDDRPCRLHADGGLGHAGDHERPVDRRLDVSAGVCRIDPMRSKG